jgi:4-hydroxybenzoyl-CoA thioesterase
VAFTRTFPVRFPDVDWARVVYFPRYFDFCHRTFEDFFAAEVGVPYARMLEERNVGFPSVHAEADYQQPLRFGDSARLTLEVLKVGNSSISCRYRVSRGEAEVLCATVQIVVAAIDIARFTRRELPDDVRAAFQRHLVAE